MADAKVHRAIVLDLKCPRCSHPQAVLTFATPEQERGDTTVRLAEGARVAVTLECADCDFSVIYGETEVR